VSFAVVAFVLAAPVVKMGAGSGVVISDGLLLTTARVARDSPRPEALLEDGGTLALLQTVEIGEGLALVAFEGRGAPAELEGGTVDAGTALRVLTAGSSWEAVVIGASGAVLELSIPDAGAVEGGALLDETGRLWGVVRDGRSAVTSVAARDAIEALVNPQKKAASARWRNLGISAAFFLGLSVWWVYRSKRRRY